MSEGKGGGLLKDDASSYTFHLALHSFSAYCTCTFPTLGSRTNPTFCKSNFVIKVRTRITLLCVQEERDFLAPAPRVSPRLQFSREIAKFRN